MPQADQLKLFLQRLFLSEDIRSLADARLRIEEEFEDKFLPDRDLLDYLI